MVKRSTGILSTGLAPQAEKDNSPKISASKLTSKPVTKAASELNENTVDSKSPSDVDTLLKADHRKVEKLFQEYESTENPEDKNRLSKQICIELIVHATLEEEVLYPACRAKKVEDTMLDEAQVEHDSAKVLITQLITLSVDSPYYDAKVKVLSEYIKHHVGEEEESSNGIFAKARSAGVDMAMLGERLQMRKKELLAYGESRLLQPPIPRSLTINPDFVNQSFKENQNMENNQHRDEQGRFTSEGNSGRGRSSSSRQDEDRYDNNRNGGRSSSQMSNRDHDEYGRSNQMNRSGRGDYDDNQERYSSGNRGNQSSNRSSQGDYEDDDDQGYRFSGNRSSQGQRSQGQHSQSNQGGGQHQGSGWFGDSQGHSEAARRGNQSSSRGDYYDDDDESYRSSGSGNRSSQGRGQQHSGGSSNSQGYSDSARHGNQSSSRSGRGYDDDQHSSRSSSSGGNRSSQGSQGGGQQHGGWFGDSEGHAEAARRGWENR